MTEAYMDDLLKTSGLTYEPYSLINNHGYHITHNGTRYDLRHWLNLYGESVNYWTIHAKDTRSKMIQEDITADALIEIMNNTEALK
jgi:hypothetical protein